MRLSRLRGGVFSNNNDAVGQPPDRQFHTIKQFPLNADDESSLTKKANYSNMSYANFQRRDGYGATGVAVECSHDIQVEREREKQSRITVKVRYNAKVISGMTDIALTLNTRDSFAGGFQQSTAVLDCVTHRTDSEA